MGITFIVRKLDFDLALLSSTCNCNNVPLFSRVMTSTINNYYEEGPPISCGLVYIIIIAGLQCNYVNKESGDDTVAEVAHVHVHM